VHAVARSERAVNLARRVAICCRCQKLLQLKLHGDAMSCWQAQADPSDLALASLFLLDRFSPIGVCSLIAAKVAEMDDLLIVVTKLGFYLVTALVGLAIHGFVTLPLIYAVTVRKNPFAYMRKCLQALVTAFATASR